MGGAATGWEGLVSKTRESVIEVCMYVCMCISCSGEEGGVHRAPLVACISLGGGRHPGLTPRRCVHTFPPVGRAHSYC